MTPNLRLKAVSERAIICAETFAHEWKQIQHLRLGGKKTFKRRILLLLHTNIDCPAQYVEVKLGFVPERSRAGDNQQEPPAELSR